MKRLLVLLLAVVFAFSLYTVSSASAFDIDSLDLYSDLFGLADSGISPLALVSYTANAFVGSVAYDTTYNLLNTSTYRVISSSIASFNVFGVRITIPSNSESGRLFVYGLFPVRYAGASSSWTSYSSSASTEGYYPYYVISKSAAFPSLLLPSYPSNQTMYTLPVANNFLGYIDIPAHNDTLYLFLYAYYYGTSGFGGGSYSSCMYFLPDSAPRDYTSQLNSLVSNTSTSNTILNNALTKLTSIDNQIAALSASVGPSAMDQFEADYLEKFEDQISKTEDFISPSNPVLPNGGDVAGFVNDISDGLGLSGSSFSASEFSDAASAFSGSASTGPGGPWEFFSQEVADSLAGGTSAAGLADDDYIYTWLDQTKRRYSQWRWSSP